MRCNDVNSPFESVELESAKLELVVTEVAATVEVARGGIEIKWLRNSVGLSEVPRHAK